MTHWIYFHFAFQQGELHFVFIFPFYYIFQYYVYITWISSLLQVVKSNFI